MATHVTEDNLESIEKSMFRLAEEGDLVGFKQHVNKVDILKNRDVNGETYLHRALSKAESDSGYLMLNFIYFLLSEAPQLAEVKNSKGKIPISLACQKNLCPPIIKRLAQCTSAGDNVKQIIPVAVESKCTFTVIELLMQKYEQDYNINTRYADGSTLLLKYGKSYYNVNKLLSYGADPNIVDNCGRSALYFATINGDRDAIKCLIEAGADPLATITAGVTKFNNNICNIITKVFQLSIQTSATNFDSDVDCTEFRNENEEWLQLFDFILNLPSLKDKPLSDTYIQLLKDMYWYFHVVEELESIIKKALVLITVNNKNAVYDTSEFLPKYRKFEEIDDIKVDLISFMLAHISQESFKARSHSRVDDFIELMFKVGFSVNKCLEDQPTALTILLACPEEETDVYATSRMVVINKLIKENVNVESMALSTATQYFQIHYGSELHSYKIKLYLPDTLVLALDTNKDVLKVLLPYWWGPPLLLLIFHSKLQNVEVHDPEELNQTLTIVHEEVFIPWLPILCSYGGIPHGTEMFKIAQSLFVLWTDLAAKGPYEKNFWAHYHTFKQVTSSPLSLQELCKYAVRGSYAERASHSHTSLPQLLHQMLPPLLRSVVMH